MKIKASATVKTNFKNADFWLLRKGSADTVGSVTKEFNEERIGLKVFKTNLILPEYLYYAMMYVHQQGFWKTVAKGTLRLVQPESALTTIKVSWLKARIISKLHERPKFGRWVWIARKEVDLQE